MCFFFFYGDAATRNLPYGLHSFPTRRSPIFSEASKEQSNGIEQVNIAITGMDKIIQQNAANAEESASASEEMNAQAEQLRDYVGDLATLVSGSKDQGAAIQTNRAIKTVSYQAKSQKHRNKKILV